MKKTKVQKWGNSLAVRLPRLVAQRIGLKEGSEVTLAEQDARLVINKVPNQIDWRDFVIPTKGKKKEPVSQSIDQILYG